MNVNYYGFLNDGASQYGSTFCGEVLMLICRHHDCARHGHYLITLSYGRFIQSINAVVDDFGNLYVKGNGE